MMSKGGEDLKPAIEIVEKPEQDGERIKVTIEVPVERVNCDNEFGGCNRFFWRRDFGRGIPKGVEFDLPEEGGGWWWLIQTGPKPQSYDEEQLRFCSLRCLLSWTQVAEEKERRK